MSARIVVTLVLEYDGSDTAEYDAAMQAAQDYVAQAGEETVDRYEAVRVLDVTVTG